MKFNYKRSPRRSSPHGSEERSRDRKRRRSSSSSSSSSLSRRRNRRKVSQHRKTQRHYSRDRPNQNRNRKDQYPRYHRRRSEQSSSSSSNHSSSNSSNSSVSSSTHRRRTTPHFKHKIGEKLGHKYKVTRQLGTGTFGRVLEARYKDELFAVKIIKPVQKYVDSAKTERSIVKTLNQADADHKSRIVKFVESFYHHQYYCMVFQPLGPSLYDVIKKNSHRGFPLRYVQSFAKQLFEAVAFMHAHSYTHTDLKPENILLLTDELKRTPHEQFENYLLPASDQVKLIDFGGATHTSERHSSIINTRQYRSPEVILQCCDWRESSDVWSIGCIVPELYTGNLLFATHDDLEHLLMMLKNSQQDKLPAWMPKRCKNDLTKVFRGEEIDERVANKRIKNWEDIIGFKRVDEIFSEVPQLSNLIMRCLQMDPSKRISCDQALKHPFFDLQL